MSIRWATDAPTRTKLPYIELRRLGPGQTIKGAVTSASYLACHCHYFTGRTLPCVDRDCPGCSIQRRRFRECYIALWTTTPGEHIILALNSSAELQLHDSHADVLDLRGTILTAQRIGPKANGRVRVTVADQKLHTSQLPAAPDLAAHLYYVWGLTNEQFGSDHPLWEVRDQLNIDQAPQHGPRVPPVNPHVAGPNDSR